MTITNSLGDLAQIFHLRRGNADIKTRLTDLSMELASGTVSDKLRHLGGDVGVLSGVESDLRLENAYAASRNEAAGFASAQQTSLDLIRDITADAGSNFMSIAANGGDAGVRAALNEASNSFDAIVGALNTSFGGRSIFSGAATRGNALAGAEDILAALSASLAGATTAADVQAIADDWFMTPGGGFDTVAYVGSPDPHAPFALDGKTTVKLELTAEDDGLRRIMREFAMAALMDEGLLSGNQAERDILLGDIGNDLLGAMTGIVEIQARLGTDEARIEDAVARGSSRRAALEMTRDQLVGVDPYETATQIENSRVQLEMIYELTARLSSLSLVSALR